MKAWERLKHWRERRWVRWMLDGVFIVAVITAVSAWQTRNHIRDEPLPVRALPRLDWNGEQTLSSEGKPTLIAFWAPWCRVCGAEVQNLNWVQRVAGEKARVVSVVLDYEDLTSVRGFIAQHGLELPVFLGDGQASRAFRVQVFPTVYFVDGQGRVKRSVSGYTTTLGLLWRLFL
jgi:thiol-disulfide isomerase/thioredoxin